MARLKNWILNLAPARAGIFCVSAALQVVFSTVIFVSANPTGEQVVSGGATFNREGNTLTINTSDRVIINWQDFSINSGEMTKFLQPGSDSAALNRVISGNPSSLLGTLSANGQIYLINPNGILVGPNAQINTAAFIASTLDLDNDEFMKGGDQRFFGDAASKIVNLGTISAQGGDVFLISREIENAGVINAEKGSVNLAAGKEVLLTQKGDQRVFVKVGSDGAPGSVQNGIVNKGLIKSVQANIEAQGNIYAYAINNSGAINATGVENKDGRVMLTATGGNIVNSGEIVAERNGFGLIRAQNAELASGSSIKATAGNNGGQITVQSAGKTTASGSVVATGTASGKGGNVSLLGHEVTAKNLTVNASGGTGGGQILVGGDKQGKNASVQNAQKTFIEKDVTLNADATVQGAGGKVIVWADDRTDFYGRISARGGETGGNGGFAEVSGKETLVYRGFADLRAPKGSTGNLL
ncbi:MAG: filamentous hemagglutinin N-terminal domain-containing protein, partial [Verrucomicrobiae bacterium]|nr:filamentous hemagglutinin N-terminal domain-containing protein [Verrucomicrobiae bacterium]